MSAPKTDKAGPTGTMFSSPLSREVPDAWWLGSSDHGGLLPALQIR